MSKPYIIVSDLHFHNFSAFSTLNSRGVNSRLQIQIDEFKRAVLILKEKGGDTIFNAGDTFHVRGRVETTVLNPVVELFNWIAKQGVVINSIPGNHDLAGSDSDIIGNAAQSLSGDKSNIVNEVTIFDEQKVIMFAWNKSIDALKERMKDECDQDYTAIIHAPVNGVIYGIPDHGIDAACLADIGYNRVFSGHYHNHKKFAGGIYSIGAMCHQTWSDVGSKAGFILVMDDDVSIFKSSHAPRFIDVTAENYDDADMLVDGNYARVKIDVTKDSEVEEIRNQFKEWGALGCVINQIKHPSVTERGEKAISTGASFEQSISEFIEAKGYDNQKELSNMCCDILSATEEIL